MREDGCRPLKSARRIVLLGSTVALVLLLTRRPHVPAPDWSAVLLPSFAPADVAALPLVTAIASFTIRSHSLHSPYLSSTLHHPASSIPAYSFEFARVLPVPSSTVLTICATASHESGWIVEWLTWHRLAGVDRFLLFDIVPGGDPGLRALLKPWRDEGVVTLFEVSWAAGDKPQTWQVSLTSFLSTYALPRLDWALFIDVDEFLAPPSPHLLPLNYPRVPAPDGARWSFALHDSLRRLDEAACVPVWPVEFANVGFRSVNGEKKPTSLADRSDDWETSRESGKTWRTVTSMNRYRVAWDQERRWGKALVHPDFQADRVTWGGIRALSKLTPASTSIAEGAGGLMIRKIEIDGCVPSEGLTTLSPYTGVEIPHYSGMGTANFSLGLSLVHYSQRTLANCLAKLAVLASRPNWRTERGAAGCHDAFIAPTVLASKLASGQLVLDQTMQESWEGRMTRAILTEWWDPHREAWKWIGKRGVDDGRGVVKLEL